MSVKGVVLVVAVVFVGNVSACGGRRRGVEVSKFERKKVGEGTRNGIALAVAYRRLLFVLVMPSVLAYRGVESSLREIERACTSRTSHVRVTANIPLRDPKGTSTVTTTHLISFREHNAIPS